MKEFEYDQFVHGVLESEDEPVVNRKSEKEKLMEELDYIAWKLDSYVETEEGVKLIEELQDCIATINLAWKENET